MRTIFIIHGSYGDPKENWFPWLKSELEKLGHHVILPQFPIPETQDIAYGGHQLSAWIDTFDEYKKFISDETVLVAHSRGCVFSYRILERQIPLHAAFLVAPWITYRWYPKGWTKIDSFHRDPFDWKKMREGTKHIEVFQSTNDEIPVAEGKEVAKNIGAEFILVKDAGHFNVVTDPKFREFDLLLEHIKRVI